MKPVAGGGGLPQNRTGSTSHRTGYAGQYASCRKTFFLQVFVNRGMPHGLVPGPFRGTP